MDRIRVLSNPVFHLSFVNHVHRFNTAHCDSGTPKRFESRHGTDLLLYKSMVLFINIIEIFTLSDLNAFTVFLIIAFDPCFVGSALVDINFDGFLWIDIALLRNLKAASLSRLAVRMKSTVRPALSTAR